jgi:hydrogenase maturation protease
MSQPQTGRVVVVGLGNPVVSDDRAGLAVASAVARLLEQRPVPGVDVLVSTRGGFELIDLLNNYSRAILVDCLSLPYPVAGRIRKLDLDDLAGSARLLNAHELSLVQACDLAFHLGITMPGEIAIWAIEGGDTCTLSDQLTPEVAAAIEPLALQIHEWLAAHPGDPGSSEQFAERRRLHAPEV